MMTQPRPHVRQSIVRHSPFRPEHKMIRVGALKRNEEEEEEKKMTGRRKDG
jgi:hypothetical protein